MNKEIPKNTLAVFEIDGDTIYLMNIEKYREEIGGDYYIHYGIIRGDVVISSSKEDMNVLLYSKRHYPEKYREEDYSLHIIPQDSICRLETHFLVVNRYENGQFTYATVQPNKYEFKGYSNDTTLLEAKILEYYLENKDKTEK